MANSVLVFGRIQIRHPSTDNSLKGYTISVSFDYPVTDFQEESQEPALTVPVAGSVPTNDDGSFRIELRPAEKPVGPITVRASSPDKSESVEKQFAIDELTNEITLAVEGYRPFTIQPQPEPIAEGVYIRGRAINARGTAIPDGLGIVLFGIDQVQGGQPGPPRIIAAGRTQADGYFTLPWVPDPFESAFVRIAGGCGAECCRTIVAGS